MKCTQCGREIPEDSRFCAYCGCEIEPARADYILPRVIKAAAPAAPEQPEKVSRPAPAPAETPAQPQLDKAPPKAAPAQAPAAEKTAPAPEKEKKPDAGQPAPAQPVLHKPQLETNTDGDTLWDVVAARFGRLWNKMDWFFRIGLILGTVSLLTLLLALILGKTAAVVFSMLQMGAAACAVLMHAKVWKLPEHRRNVPWLVLLAIVPVLLLCLWSFSWGGAKPPKEPVPTPEPVVTPAPAPARVQTPFSEQESVGKPYTDIQEAFAAAGFQHIMAQPIEDLHYDQADRQNTVESVSINDSRDFAQQQDFDPEDVVVIRYHVYQKCRVTFRADVKENFLFSKYDVDVKIDGVHRDTVAHGAGADFAFELEPGLHILTFHKAGAEQPAGEIKLDVKGDIKAQFALQCARNELKVETVYLTELGPLDENQAVLPDTLFTVKEFSPEVLVQEFDFAGFSNITLEPVYDVKAGSEELGLVARVSIDGRTDLQQGEVLPRDVPILIQYHEDEAKNPAANG